MSRIPILTLSILFALLASYKYEAEGIACHSSTIYWFQVKHAIFKPSCSSIIHTDLILPVDGMTTGMIDVPTEAPQGQSNSPFGCPDIGVFICAIAFEGNQIELVTNPSNPIEYIWRPKSSEIPNYKCCIKKLHVSIHITKKEALSKLSV
jgi:hypothetical protein